MPSDLPYQRRGVRKIHRFGGRALLADEMGLGKTRQALRWLEERPDAQPALVVCPSNLKWVWQSEIKEVLGIPCEILSGQTPAPTRLHKFQSITIINYEILKYWREWILTLNPRTMILDECHFCKNPMAKRTRAVRNLARGIPHIIAISGTPLLNRPAELWTTVNLVRPDVFDNISLFRWRYCDPIRKPWGWEYKGATHIKELHDRLRSTMMIRRLKKQVLPELPPKTRMVIPLEIENRKEYAEALSDFLGWLSKASAAKAKRASKAEKLTKIGYLKRLAALGKVNAMIERIESFLEESDGKLVVMTCHRKIIKQLREKFKDISVVVDGTVSPTKRKRAVRVFQTNKKIRLFFGQIKVAGIGLTLTAADTLAFAELDWVPGNHIQAEDRIHRISTKNPVTILYWVAKDTIEETLCRIIQTKQNIVSDTLDGRRGARNRLNVWNELINALQRT